MNTETEKKPQASDITREYYSPQNADAAEKAVELARNVCETNALPLMFNFDTNAGLPDGYGVGVIPLQQTREDEGRVTIGCIIAAIPDPVLVLAHEKGENWARQVMIERCMAKVANAARPKKDADGDDTGPATLPFSVEDFILTQTRDSGLATYRAYKKGYIAGLQQMGLSTLNDKTFREVLQSAQLAKQHYPKIPQTTWKGLLEKMIARANRENLDPGILSVWLNTRDTATIELPADFDVDALDALAESETDEATS